jgi:hypothetical protein
MLKKNDTYELVPLPVGQKSIGVKWVYKIKLNPDNSINKYKTRLVAKGFSQRQEIDFHETYAPVAKMASIHLLLATAAAERLLVEQLDVDSAYLNGEMDTEVYMDQPPGFVDPIKPNHVCHLKKTLYGLKQAGHHWNALANAYLLELGFTRLLSDSCIYSKQIGNASIYVGLYVDDFIYASTPEINKWFAEAMAKCFSIKALGPVKHILGIRVEQIPQGISLTQSAYLSCTLAEMNMFDCRPSHLPLTGGDVTAAIKCADNNNFVDQTHYQYIIRKIMYTAVGTHPDISFAVGFLAHYAHNPTVHHLKMAKILLRYLSATLDYLLFYPATGSFELEAYSDSDWAGVHDSRSTTGTLTLANGIALT